jgi:hypothetical protein
VDEFHGAPWGIGTVANAVFVMGKAWQSSAKNTTRRPGKRFLSVSIGVHRWQTRFLFSWYMVAQFQAWADNQGPIHKPMKKRFATD